MTKRTLLGTVAASGLLLGASVLPATAATAATHPSQRCENAIAAQHRADVAQTKAKDALARARAEARQAAQTKNAKAQAQAQRREKAAAARLAAAKAHTRKANAHRRHHCGNATTPGSTTTTGTTGTTATTTP